VRLDQYLVVKGYFPSRSKAKDAIKNGKVKVDDKLAKASFSLKGTERIEVKVEEIRFVSRGGFKLLHALNTFALDVKGLRALDIGASTGGFTDCLLQNGAKEVVAVDVGIGQLVESLKTDPRVISMEKTNIRELVPESVGKFQLITIDVSFISLTKFLDRLPLFLEEDSHIIALIKPQFEAGPKNVKKGGIVKSPRVHLEVLENVIKSAKSAGLHIWDITYSPLAGGSGNIEFLGWFRMQKNTDFNRNLKSVIDNAYMQVIP